jgi:hypothetical protein
MDYLVSVDTWHWIAVREARSIMKVARINEQKVNSLFLQIKLVVTLEKE